MPQWGRPQHPHIHHVHTHCLLDGPRQEMPQEGQFRLYIIYINLYFDLGVDHGGCYDWQHQFLVWYAQNRACNQSGSYLGWSSECKTDFSQPAQRTQGSQQVAGDWRRAPVPGALRAPTSFSGPTCKWTLAPLWTSLLSWLPGTRVPTVTWRDFECWWMEELVEPWVPSILLLPPWWVVGTIKINNWRFSLVLMKLNGFFKL